MKSQLHIRNVMSEGWSGDNVKLVHATNSHLKFSVACKNLKLAYNGKPIKHACCSCHETPNLTL